MRWPIKPAMTSEAATCTGDYCTDVAAHAPEARLKGESLDFRRKARVSRRAGVIDSCLLNKLILARGQVPHMWEKSAQSLTDDEQHLEIMIYICY